MPLKDPTTRATYNAKYGVEYRSRPEVIARTATYVKAHKAERAAYNKQYKIENRDKINELARRHSATPKGKKTKKAGHLKRRYNITLEQYEAVLLAQNYCCALCFEPLKSGRFVHVDHKHGTKLVRGILCNGCNCSVGKIETRSQEWLARLLKYIGRTQ
jgi:hypothetical protein